MYEISVTRLCLSKVEGMVIRTWDILRYFPVRLYRVLNHLVRPFLSTVSRPAYVLDFRRNGFWLIELIFLLLDLIGVSEVYETVCDLIKFNTRPLNAPERKALKEIFGATIPLERIRIDEAAFIGPRFMPLAYVGFYTINCWGGMSKATFVHELVHVWHYHQQGSTYIPQALVAQYSEEGYNYGGVEGLQAAVASGKGIDYFNLEQQGDVVADYYRLKRNVQPRWASRSSIQLDLFEQLIAPLREG